MNDVPLFSTWSEFFFFSPEVVSCGTCQHQICEWALQILRSSPHAMLICFSLLECYLFEICLVWTVANTTKNGWSIFNMRWSIDIKYTIQSHHNTCLCGVDSSLQTLLYTNRVERDPCMIPSPHPILIHKVP